MADEFNLVPTNNLEKHLDNILRTAQGEEPQYDLAPNWRTEQYLAAIASALASGGGGGVLVVGCTASGELGNVYTLDKTWQEIQDADYPVAVMRDEYGNIYGIILYTQFSVPLNAYSVGVEGLFMEAVDFATNSASGYPTYTAE